MKWPSAKWQFWCCFVTELSSRTLEQLRKYKAGRVSHEKWNSVPCRVQVMQPLKPQTVWPSQIPFFFNSKCFRFPVQLPRTSTGQETQLFLCCTEQTPTTPGLFPQPNPAALPLLLLHKAKQEEKTASKRVLELLSISLAQQSVQEC